MWEIIDDRPIFSDRLKDTEEPYILPDEILVIIFSFLEPTWDQFLPLARVCRKWRRLSSWDIFWRKIWRGVSRPIESFTIGWPKQSNYITPNFVVDGQSSVELKYLFMAVVHILQAVTMDAKGSWEIDTLNQKEIDTLFEICGIDPELITLPKKFWCRHFSYFWSEFLSGISPHQQSIGRCYKDSLEESRSIKIKTPPPYKPKYSGKKGSGGGRRKYR
jgi:hypothetical protein